MPHYFMYIRCQMYKCNMFTGQDFTIETLTVPVNKCVCIDIYSQYANRKIEAQYETLNGYIPFT